MTGFAQQQLAPFKKQFMSLPRQVARMPLPRPAARDHVVATKAALKKAEDYHYAAVAAAELKDKHDAVTKTQKKLAVAAAEVQATKNLKAQKKAAMDIIPDHHDKTTTIEQHNDAGAAHEDAKDKHKQAKNAHKEAQEAVQAGGRRRRRKTRRKRRKSKHRRRKRHTKKRKRNTKKRKRNTKRRRRSRRR